ncbi:MAG: putative prolyl-tRNA synthetase, prolyl-tRNA synthetase [Candidatus Saccharibacteria bacterium]|nr:putative prolyl-tRNA synthetase, prolyl-tRNA synthetase [Candidatus Saccharibacteria bacterium]
MRLSTNFTKTKKQVPADEQSKNAQLLIQAGFVHKEMAGVYSYLPLGLKVLNKIAQIVREEMDAVGGQEILMTALQVKERYEATGRWSDKVVDNWFKTKLANGTEVGLGFTHEENLTPIVKSYLNSYKDLPLAIYQIQTKFRNELRSKSGLMRGREFLMKDMYTYALTQEQHDEYYEKIAQAYRRVYDRLGIGERTFKTFASGGVFSKFSHEFQTVSDAGEDTIYLDKKRKLAINKEVFTDEIIHDLGLTKSELEEVKGIEVGNIFSLGTKFTKPFEVEVEDAEGGRVAPLMGCYGIGISRLMGTIAEVMSDEKGLIWPENIAPAKVYLVRLGEKNAKVADELYENLLQIGVEVIYDDRDARAGEKFADADLLGIPYRIVISDKTVEAGKHELKQRTEAQAQSLGLAEIVKTLAGDNKV